MNIVNDKSDNIEKRLKDVEDGLAAVKETLRNVTGSPIIKAHSGVRFDMNDNLDAKDLRLVLRKIQYRLTLLEMEDE